ncbi:diphthine--ammonia ligase [Bacillus sp. B190/17]|uniref:Diphthine--ammonia ligase n=1 Tax=Bacillus lumedeiriae TaxID=3058829 RepID=A0ABW8I9C8_9BACI
MANRVVLSWSGGKDSCMALTKLVHAGHEVVSLLTTVPKESDRTFAHGEKIEMIEQQSKSLAIPVHFVHCPLEQYTETFIKDLIQLKEQLSLDSVAFGDIYLDGHREWGENVAAAAGLEAIFPLWRRQEESLALLTSFVQSGYKAAVIRIRQDIFDDSWLGKELDHDFLASIQEHPVCPLGENGEYHTFVYDGPLFQSSIPFTRGSIIAQENSKRLEIGLLA